MLTNDDLSSYKSKDDYLASLRSRNNGSRSEQRQDNGGTSNFSDAIRGAIQRAQSGYRTDDGQGRAEEQRLYGSNGSTSSTTRSSGGIAEQLRSIPDQSPRDNRGAYQYKRPATGDGTKSRWSGLKGAWDKYKDAVRPPRVVENQGQGSKTKQEKKSPRLTDTEAIRLRPKLIEYFEWQTEHMDQFIIATTGGHDPTIEIWGDISHDEIEIIVDYLLTRGKTDTKTAQAVRYAAILLDRIKLGLIILPRAYKTLMIYIERGFTIH